MESIVARLKEIGTDYGLQVIGALVILIVGWIASKWLAKLTRRGLGKIKRVDAIVAGFAATLVRWAVMVFTIFAVLNRFGVETASLLAVLGAAGLAVGLALQGTLSNLAAGVMLLVFRPFRIGDFVDAGGQSGTVKMLGLLTTELDTPQNVRIIVPNGKIWGDAIRNYNRHDTRRLDILMGIDYGDSIDLAMQISKDVVESEERALKEPAPAYIVKELGESSINIELRIWCATADYWALRFSLLKALKEAFDAAGLSIPFPQQDVHMYHKTMPDQITAAAVPPGQGSPGAAQSGSGQTTN